jgi:hypothetical protein
LNNSKPLENKNVFELRLLLEFDYYLVFFQNFFVFPSIFKLFYLQKLFVHYQKLCSFLSLNFTPQYKYDNLAVNSVFTKITPYNPSNKYVIVKHEAKAPRFRIYFFFKILNLLFLFNNFVLDPEAKLHFNYKLLFGRKIKSTLWINNNRFIHAWLDGFSLIYNIFYFNYNPLLFGSMMFKKEILSFNWYFYQTEIPSWKHSFVFFVFKASRLTKKIDFFYKKTCKMGLDFAMISDTFYHAKNLYYFNKYKIFSVGLTNAATNPWLVSYAIPSLLNGFLTEFFFLKTLSVLKQHAEEVKFNIFKKNWFNLFTNSKGIRF